MGKFRTPSLRVLEVTPRLTCTTALSSRSKKWLTFYNDGAGEDQFEALGGV